MQQHANRGRLPVTAATAQFWALEQMAANVRPRPRREPLLRRIMLLLTRLTSTV